MATKASASLPLLPSAPALKPKPVLWFGYLPTWSETVPLDPATGRIDTVRVAANVLAGLIIGVRQTLSAIVSATLVFASAEDPLVTSMFPFGISMMWFSTLAGSLWYAIFGRLQYNTNATQEVCAILYAAMAQVAATRLKDSPEKVAPTILALIMASTVLTGLCALVAGKLGVGKLIERFPKPVTTGFLGTIGWFLVKTAVQISSGVQIQYFYPADWAAFCTTGTLAKMTALLAMVLFMRKGPALLNRCFGDNKAMNMLGNLACQLFPLVLFYVVVLSFGFTMDTLSDNGWTYAAEAGGDFFSLWTTYRVSDADFGVVLSQVPKMFSLVLISVLCTMTGVLGISGKFPSGPDGDPAPDDMLSFDRELTTVGLGSILIGLGNGVVTFHRLGSSIQLRRDGGTHRIGVLSSAGFVAVFFFSSLPLGHYIPKFFLGGLFMGSGISLVEDALFSYRTLPGGPEFFGRSMPSGQYLVTLCCVITSVFSSPFTAIGVGLLLCVLLFLVQSASLPPVGAITDGRNTVSRTLRPVWELRVLREHGSSIIVLYLQGSLFFGTGQALATEMVGQVQSAKARYCILSFAKVRAVDASACDQLKSAIQKLQRAGCKVVCCRMSDAIFRAMSAAKVVQAPDHDLRALRNGGGEHTFVRIGQGDSDSVDHETDALDYCGDKILEEYLYSRTNLSHHVLAFRTACTLGVRLAETDFEAISQLPPGTMRDLRPHVEVRSGLPIGEHIKGDSDSICFLLQGSITAIDELSKDDNQLQKGFGGRGGKRLRKRYPPGHILQKSFFFLQKYDWVVDDTLKSSLVVGSKFGQETELWVLSRERWDKLPPQLQKVIQDSMSLQMAHERQHTLLSGE